MKCTTCNSPDIELSERNIPNEYFCLSCDDWFDAPSVDLKKTLMENLQIKVDDQVSGYYVQLLFDGELIYEAKLPESSHYCC